MSGCGAMRENGSKVLCVKCNQHKNDTEFYKLATGYRFRKCKICSRAEKAQWREAHLEACKEYGKRYYRNHRESMLKYQRQRKSTYRPSPEASREYTRRWSAAHPEQLRERWARRRARKQNAPVVEKIDRDYIFRRDKGKCHLCGKKVDPKNWHLDHLLSLSMGGEHSYRNVAVTHPRCNLRKGTGRLPSQLRLSG